MARLLFLVHRIPYPPNKGDKIRSWNILRHLARDHKVSLGCFVDDAEDLAYVGRLKEMCRDIYAERVRAPLAKLRSLAGLATGEALSVRYYRSPGMRRWVAGLLASGEVDAVIGFSSAMAQFVMPWADDYRFIMDFVDVDSDKWRQYAAAKPWPMSWLYGREARHLLAHEKRVAKAAEASLLVSPDEVALLKSLAPGLDDKILCMQNGVDSAFFDPSLPFDRPFPSKGPVVAFTGAMDYWANVEAVVWFADTAWPAVRKGAPSAEFWIVGGKPAAEVSKLAGRPGIVVTGRVEDVRPYIAHADAIVAPMRTARGVQNKVLEGMAMARPVLTTSMGYEGLTAEIGSELMVTDLAEEFSDALLQILKSESANHMGKRARARILSDYAWSAQLGVLDRIISEEDGRNSKPRAG